MRWVWAARVAAVTLCGVAAVVAGLCVGASAASGSDAGVILHPGQSRKVGAYTVVCTTRTIAPTKTRIVLHPGHHVRLAGLVVACERAPVPTPTSTVTAPTPPASLGAVKISGFGFDRPETLEVGEGVLWVQPHAGDTLYAVDPATNKVAGQIALPNNRICGLDASIPGTVWISDCGPPGVIPGVSGVLRIDAATKTVTATVPGPNGGRLVIGAGSLWATDRDGNDVWRIDPSTGAVLAKVPVGSTPIDITLADGSIWVGNAADGTVSRIDPATNSVVATLHAGAGDPNAVGAAPAMAAGGGALWVGNGIDNKLYKIDTTTNTSTAFDIGAGSRANWPTMSLSYGLDSVWALADVCTIVRVDPTSGSVLKRYTVCDPSKVFGTSAVTVAFGSLWFSYPENHVLWRVQP